MESPWQNCGDYSLRSFIEQQGFRHPIGLIVSMRRKGRYLQVIDVEARSLTGEKHSC